LLNAIIHAGTKYLTSAPYFDGDVFFRSNYLENIMSMKVNFPLE
jgi:hypothetical protein